MMAALALLIAVGSGPGFFGGVTVLAVSVAGFGLLVALCTELLGEN